MRALHLVRSLAELGPVDVVVTEPLSPADLDRIRADLGDVRLFSPAVGDAPTWSWVGRWLLSPRLPAELCAMDRRGLRRDFAQWRRAQYDVALFIRIPSWYALHAEISAPQVVDFDDLMDVWTSRRIELRKEENVDSLSAWERLRRHVRAWRLRSDASRWSRYQDQVARAVQAVTVCSRIDAVRLDHENAIVVPNGYELEGEPVGRSVVGSPPTFVFPGFIKYLPNLDAARYLVREVLPLLRRFVPTCRVIIAGEAPAEVHAMADDQSVTVTGHVARMEDVLMAADAVIVPIRMGGGTRIKIVEAWAHRIPVVSTTVGAEGLDCESGHEVLLADTPEEFARACELVVSDLELRRRMVEAGSERASHLTWSGIRRGFADELSTLLAEGKGAQDDEHRSG